MAFPILVRAYSKLLLQFPLRPPKATLNVLGAHWERRFLFHVLLVFRCKNEGIFDLAGAYSKPLHQLLVWPPLEILGIY